MASARDLMVIAGDAGFQKRVKYNMQQIAIYDIQVPVTSAVPYCKTILLGTASVYEMAVGVVSNADVKLVATSTSDGTDTFGISDQLLYDTVNSLMPAFAATVS